MNDPLVVVRRFLLAQAELQALFGQRIYAARNLPSGYEPKNGAALVINNRGGNQHFSSEVHTLSLQCRVYAATESLAQDLCWKIYEVCNDRTSREIVYMRMEDGTMPQIINEPVVGWPIGLIFFRVQVRKL